MKRLEVSGGGTTPIRVVRLQRVKVDCFVAIFKVISA